MSTMSTMSNVNNALSNVKNVTCILKEDLPRSVEISPDQSRSIKPIWSLNETCLVVSKCQSNCQIITISNAMYYQSVYINLAHRLCPDFQYFFHFLKFHFSHFIQLKNVSCDELSIFYFWKHIEKQKGISTKLIWSKHIYWSHMIV